MSFSLLSRKMESSCSPELSFEIEIATKLLPECGNFSTQPNFIAIKWILVNESARVMDYLI